MQLLRRRTLFEDLNVGRRVLDDRQHEWPSALSVHRPESVVLRAASRGRLVPLYRGQHHFPHLVAFRQPATVNHHAKEFTSLLHGTVSRQRIDQLLTMHRQELCAHFWCGVHCPTFVRPSWIHSSFGNIRVELLEYRELPKARLLHSLLRRRNRCR